MAENILHDFDESLTGGVTLVPSGGGVFEVNVGERVVFSKKQSGRFPEENEVEEALEGLLGE
ncbi:MAG: Rdx family protein [Chloroflexota bacterium]|nr:Rdx family protein [Chloroflexota bacterium]